MSADGAAQGKEAFITLATTDEYALGAAVWAYSIKESGSSKDLVCMITKDVSEKIRALLSSIFSHVEMVNILDSGDEVNLALLQRPDLGVTFTKIHCWRLTQYTKAVFMDADTLVSKNVDCLFDREEFSAAPDPGWPDIFNSGVFVFRPNLNTYKKLLEFALKEGSFDGGDQGLLNMFFSDWATKDINCHLPFVYNCISTSFYSYPPAWKKFHHNIRVVHFIGAKKPWHYQLDSKTGRPLIDSCQEKGLHESLNCWWKIFVTKVQPHLDTDLTGLVGELAAFEFPKYDSPASASSTSSADRQSAWERGQIDYTGSDRFENIKSKLDDSLKKKDS